MKRTILSVILTNLGGLLVYLIALAIANVLTLYISNNIYLQTIAFLNDNLVLVITFSIILFFGELFSVFSFPINLPYPIINAYGSIYVVTFMLRIIGLVKGFVGIASIPILSSLKFLIYPIVILIVLIVGYVNIFTKLSKIEKKKEEKIPTKKEKDWRDKIREFTEHINDFMNKINNALFSKKKKK